MACPTGMFPVPCPVLQRTILSLGGVFDNAAGIVVADLIAAGYGPNGWAYGEGGPYMVTGAGDVVLGPAGPGAPGGPI
jgi:hypothetical protein